MMPNDLDEPTPTVADEASAVVDDAQVISKTLPTASVPPGTARLKSQVEHSLDVVRGYVIRQPMCAVLIAAIGGAALSALLSGRRRADDAWREQPTYR
ncbi:hypothetical protein C7T35_15615 [Variovorax sp. WS11]|nr:hypothetical protein [Variovorax sp. WS11]PSL83548.1 hypothetical protein C7T35_15615 [Variovorax sp. WS11]